MGRLINNFKRRKREAAIAREYAEDLFKASRSVGANDVPLDKKADLFGLVCKRHKLDEAEAARVFGYVPKAQAAMQRELDRLNTTVVRTAETLEDVARRPRR